MLKGRKKMFKCQSYIIWVFSSLKIICGQKYHFESLGYSIDHPGFKSRLLIYLVISCNSCFYAQMYFLHVHLDMKACLKFWNFDTFFTIRSLDLTIVLTPANKFRSLIYLGRYVTEKFKTVIFSSYSNRFSKEW